MNTSNSSRSSQPMQPEHGDRESRIQNLFSRRKQYGSKKLKEFPRLWNKCKIHQNQQNHHKSQRQMTGNEQRASQSGAGVVAIFTAQCRDHIRGFDDTRNPIDPATFGGTDAERLLMLFAVCEARSADGKPLRGSVMNMSLFMIFFWGPLTVNIPAGCPK